MTVKEHEIRWSASEIPIGANVHMFSADGTPTRECGRKYGREMVFLYSARGSGGSGATALYALDANGKTEGAVSPKSLREDLYFSPLETFTRESAPLGRYAVCDEKGNVIEEVISPKRGEFRSVLREIQREFNKNTSLPEYDTTYRLPPDAVLVKIGEYEPLR